MESEVTNFLEKEGFPKLDATEAEKFREGGFRKPDFELKKPNKERVTKMKRKSS